MKHLLLAALLASFAACMSDDPEALRADLETSVATQELSVCASSCDPPTYSGVPVSCASNYGCYSDAGGAYCWQGYYWQNVYCAPAPQPCGNGVCDPGETYTTCPADCPSCGDGTCASNESVNNCQQDCAGTCGDGICNWYFESEYSCHSDCGYPDPNDCNPICR